VPPDNVISLPLPTSAVCLSLTATDIHRMPRRHAASVSTPLCYCCLLVDCITFPPGLPPMSPTREYGRRRCHDVSLRAAMSPATAAILRFYVRQQFRYTPFGMPPEDPTPPPRTTPATPHAPQAFYAPFSLHALLSPAPVYAALKTDELRYSRRRLPSPGLSSPHRTTHA